MNDSNTNTTDSRTERRYLSELEVAARYGLSVKTLQKWRSSDSTGPVFAKFGRKVAYPLDGPRGLIDWEQSVLYRSTSQRLNKSRKG